ncbi:MAG: pyridoxamine 5'-phosphate oxidase family protein [Nocardioidaceae bacterium]|nr:pyridoxamine 5'-phosphate oxidase family protein [Nocardioidaceae bacterium]
MEHPRPFPPSPTRGHQVDLEPARCWALVDEQEVGRIALVVDDAIQVLPVAYVRVDETVYFRTSAFGLIARHVDGQPASFEVDDVHTDERSGWSVLLTGTARRVVDPELLARLWTPSPPLPWADGVRNLWVGITVEHVTGRSVQQR